MATALIVGILCGFITGNFTGVWFLANRVVEAARIRADHAAGCLLEQQTENENLRQQIKELTYDLNSRNNLLESVNEQVRENRKQIRALKRGQTKPAKTTRKPTGRKRRS